MLVTEVKRSGFEYLDSAELAARWKLPVSWIREQVRRRSDDPLPHVRFGKYVRFRWGSAELDDWAERRMVSGRTSSPPTARRGRQRR